MVNHNRGLFWWSDVERRPELERLEMVLKALPDEELLAALEQRRGRDDYPIRAMWRALVAGIVFQHVSIQSLLRELRRNPALLEVCGFDRLGPRRRPKREVVVGAGGTEGGVEGGTERGWGTVGLEFLPIFEFSGEAGGGTGTDGGDDGAAAGATDGGGGGVRGASGVRREGGGEPFDGEEEGCWVRRRADAFEGA